MNETTIAAIISACSIALVQGIVLILAYKTKHNKLLNSTKDIPEDHKELKAINSDLLINQSNLASDHKFINMNQENLQRILIENKDINTTIKDKVITIVGKIEKEERYYDNLNDKQKDIKHSINNILAMQLQLEKVVDENNGLNERVYKLIESINILKIKNKDLIEKNRDLAKKNQELIKQNSRRKQKSRNISFDREL